MWHERDWCSFDGLFWSEPSMQFNYPCATKYFLPADWILSHELICCTYLQLKSCFRFMTQILMRLEFHQISARMTTNKTDMSLTDFTKIKLGVSTTDVESRSREARLIWTPYARQWLIRSGLANEWPAYGRARNPWWLLAKAARSVHLDNHLNFGGVRKNPSTIGSMSLHNFSAVLETPDCEIMILI